MKYIDVDLLLKEIEKKSHEEQGFSSEDSEYGYRSCARDLLAFINSLQQEQQEVNLEEFTEKMNAWKARFNSPDDIPIKATMAFTARMFYQYPNVARQWYDGLPKVTQD